jgi:hypothetical protein
LQQIADIARAATAAAGAFEQVAAKLRVRPKRQQRGKWQQQECCEAAEGCSSMDVDHDECLFVL